MQNAKTSTTFLKRGEYIENEYMSVYIWIYLSSKFFFRIEKVLSKTFLKKTISSLTIQFIYQGDTLDK